MLALFHGDEKANANSALVTIRKIHLTRLSVCTLLFCCRAAAIAFAPSSPILLPPCKTHVGLTHGDEKANANSALKHNHTLTRFSLFTRLISPVLMRAANATQSAAETPHVFASISSLSTSNSLLPNFTRCTTAAMHFALQTYFNRVRGSRNWEEEAGRGGGGGGKGRGG
jgi:hypothetical protein